MLSLGLAKNQYIVEIHYDEFSQVWFQYVIHQPHERVGCVCQPKWHNQPFIQPFLHLEGCLPFITLSDPYLKKTTLQVDIGQVSNPTQTTDHII